jgi:UDP-glucose 4-epimerase
VTGGAGFIGSHLVDALLRSGDRVFVIDDLSTGNLANLAKWKSSDKLRVEIAKVQETPVLASWMLEVDLVLHFAATVGVRRVMENRVGTLRNNLQSTEAVLERACHSRTMVFLASTSEVYGTSDKVPFAERQSVRLSSPDSGRWCYAASKTMCEFMALAYKKEKGLPVVIGRLFNTSGPRQAAAFGMVLPSFVRQALREEPITVYGDGTQTRSFAHVEDVVQAVLDLVGTNEAVGEIFNIGNDREISIGALAHRVKELTGSTSPIVFTPVEKVYNDFVDMRRRVPDLRKIREAIDYHPKKNIDDIIVSVISYTSTADAES